MVWSAAPCIELKANSEVRLKSVSIPTLKVMEMLVTQLPLNYPQDALPPGTQVNGYTIKNVLGRGTFGITYLAEETH